MQNSSKFSHFDLGHLCSGPWWLPVQVQILFRVGTDLRPHKRSLLQPHPHAAHRRRIRCSHWPVRPL